jgi:hypothetical protein
MDTKLKFLGTYKNLYRFYYFQNDPLITGERMRGCNSDNWTDTMVLSIVIPLRMLALHFSRGKDENMLEKNKYYMYNV